MKKLNNKKMIKKYLFNLMDKEDLLKINQLKKIINYKPNNFYKSKSKKKKINKKKK